MFGVYLGTRCWCICPARSDADRMAELLVAAGYGFVHVRAIG